MANKRFWGVFLNVRIEKTRGCFNIKKLERIEVMFLEIKRDQEAKD